MTFKYKNVYINETSTITGPFEAKGPLGRYYDKSYHDLYMGQKTWGQAESKLLEESVELLLTKMDKSKQDIDILISGDLSNQLSSTNFAASHLSIPLIGVYGACSTSCLNLAIGANMVEKKQVKNAYKLLGKSKFLDKSRKDISKQLPKNFSFVIDSQLD